MYDERSIIQTFRGIEEKFVISRVRYVERFYRGLYSQGEKTLIPYRELVLSRFPIIERTLYNLWRQASCKQQEAIALACCYGYTFCTTMTIQFLKKMFIREKVT